MAKQLQNISIAAPGFLGINTEQSPVEQNPNFAQAANNCILDRDGRLKSRQGYNYVTTDASELSGSDGIETMYVYVEPDGDEVFLSAGNNKILTGSTTLVDATPGAATITANNWQVAELNEKVYFFQSGHDPLVYENSTGLVKRVVDATGSNGTPPSGNCVLAAFGRLWAGATTTDKHTISWSDTLNGLHWSGGTSGSIDLDNVWPNGNDELVALAEHNNFLIIFGKNSIVIYQGAEDPSTMTLYDAIRGIGCAARDSVQSIGTDLLFLDSVGVRTISRTIQEKSAPIGDVTRNVRTDLIAKIRAETGNIKGVYSPSDNFYLLSFPSQGIIYCADLKAMLEDGSRRITTWTDIEPLCFYVARDDTLYMGHPEGISQYTSYNDGPSGTYIMTYDVNSLGFGNTSILKFLKKLFVTTVGASGVNVNVRWSYDYKENYKTSTFTILDKSAAEYGEAEYGIAEYTDGILITRANVVPNGSGFVASVGLTVTIDGGAVSVQQIDIMALTGSLI